MLALVLAAVLPLLPADQSPPPSRSGDAGQTGPLLAPRSLTRLFSVPALPPSDGRKAGVVEAPKERVRKRVVCGMTVLIVDGSADPKMVIAPSAGKDVDPRMPRVPKPMCGSR
jgi:hypothetical protein